jgi:phosphate/sulfate permease
MVPGADAVDSLGDGGNDAQKTMAAIAALLYAHGEVGGDLYVHLWIVLNRQTAMALGTLPISAVTGYGLARLADRVSG